MPEASGTGYVDRSVEALAQYAETIEKNYGVTPLSSFVVALKDSDTVSSLGERVSFVNLPDRVRQVVDSRVSHEERS